LRLQQFSIITLFIFSTLSINFISCLKESNLELEVDTTIIARIYQPDELIGKDAIIESISPDQNSGNSTYFTVFSWTNGGTFNNARALIEFDFSDVPTQTKIAAAKLSLSWISYDNLTFQTGENAFSIFKIIQPWEENSVTWNNQPLTSDVNKVSIPKSTSTDQAYTDIDVTALVQDMIDYPTENYGFMLKLEEEFPYKLVILASSDYPENNKRPKLVVYY
jgi:hypothetical protein